MDEEFRSSRRKDDHLRITLEEDVQSGIKTGLDEVRLVHEALPEMRLEEVSTEQVLFGKKLKSPLIISSMTGGSRDGGEINRRLARAAQQAGIGMGLGSMRAALDDKAQLATYQVRSEAPDILLLTNLGAVQLNYGVSVDDCRRAVEWVEADGLILHLNALQEALQPEGETNFSGLLKKIETVCHSLSVPVIIKEVGWGISAHTAETLVNCGVSAVDVAGGGGTSWSQVEMYRHTDPARAEMVSHFRSWGISTADSLRQIHARLPELTLIASGGLKTGIETAKCLALGAACAGMAGAFLKPAMESEEKLNQVINLISDEVRICMFACGCKTIRDLPDRLAAR